MMDKIFTKMGFEAYNHLLFSPMWILEFEVKVINLDSNLEEVHQLLYSTKIKRENNITDEIKQKAHENIFANFHTQDGIGNIKVIDVKLIKSYR